MNTALRRRSPRRWAVTIRRRRTLMAAKFDYQWHLRQVIAGRGMFATTDLIGPLAERGIQLSPSQVYRLVVERPGG